MECDGPTAEANGTCREKCTCHPDNKDASSVVKNPSPHPHVKKTRKKLSHPDFGPKEMNKMKHIFTKWIREYTGGGEKGTQEDKTIKDERFRFINKMMSNYQHFRRKEKALTLLQEQQDELKDQQEHLEKLLTKQEETLTRTGSTHDKVATPSPVKSGWKRPHGDDVNITITTTNTTQAPPTTQAPINQQASNEIEAIKKQITEIQNQQTFLSKQQTQLAAQLAKEQALFEQARQLIMLLLKKNQGATNASPTVPATQSDYGGGFHEEALPNGEPAQASNLLNQLQNVLSKLIFTEDGNTLQNDGQQTMLLQQNQDQDQSGGIQTENSIYDKSGDTHQEPSNMMYNIPVEIDRNDINDQGQRNSLFGRNDVDNDSEDDSEDMPFVMDRDYSDDETEPEFASLEKKTLHSPKSKVNIHQNRKMLKKDKSKLIKKDKSSGQTKKQKNHVKNNRT